MTKSKPVIGIAFGGGGIRGFAHLAVMEKLAELGIKADMVAGTSIGSGMAALYACGKTGKEHVDYALNLQIAKLFKISNKRGILNGRKYAETVAEMAGITNIEECPIPLTIVATDLETWEPHIFQTGELAVAIQASSAVPWAFSPIELGDKLLVDGGLVNNCPADLLREQGAEIIIAIDLDHRGTTKPKNVFEIALRSMEIAMAQGRKPVEADFVIYPFHEKSINAAAVLKYKDCYELGKKAMERQTDELVATIQKRCVELGYDPNAAFTKA